MVVIDASVWVSNLVTHDGNHQASQRWLRSQTASSVRLAIPSIALPEVAGSIARREHSVAAGRAALRWILRISTLHVVEINRALGRRAALIAATYRLRGADAVYVAVAEELEMPLVTWDTELLERASSIVDVFQP